MFGTGQIGTVPFGNPRNPWPAEAVWDWRGFGYLYMTVDAPVAATLTLTVWYFDSETFSDTHLSDSTRQTDYEYDTGTLQTFTTTAQVDAGTGQAVCFDLAGGTICLVQDMQVAFSQPGDWRIGEPLLRLDAGDLKPEREAVTPHFGVKVFENFAYSESGMAAFVDGVPEKALWCPDNYMPNTVERSVGFLNPVTGAGSGLDLTTCYTAAQMASLCEISGNAWDSTYDTAARDTHLVDEDDAALKADFLAYDMRPRFPAGHNDTTSTAIDLCLNCGSWVAATGIKYAWHVEHVVHGQIIGRATTGSTVNTRARSRTNFAKAWRRIDGGSAYTEDPDVSSDAHGLYLTQGMEVVDYDATFAADVWDYMVQQDSAPWNSAGRLATREWQIARAVATTGLHPFLREGAYTRLYLVANVDGTVRMMRLPYGMSWDAADTEFDATACGGWPAIAYCRPLLGGAILHGETTQQGSWWRGDTNDWETAVDLSSLGLTYPYPDYGLGMDVTSIGGYADGAHHVGRVDWNTKALRELTQVAAGDDAPGALSIQRDLRRLYYAVPVSGDLNIYMSEDDGRTWAYQFASAGLTNPSLDASSPYRLYLTGYAGGLGYVERYDYSSPNVLLSTGRCTIGSSDDDRVAFAHHRNSLGLVAVLCSGGSLQEYRSTDDGETWTLQGTIATA